MGLLIPKTSSSCLGILDFTGKYFNIIAYRCQHGVDSFENDVTVLKAESLVLIENQVGTHLMVGSDILH